MGFGDQNSADSEGTANQLIAGGRIDNRPSISAIDKRLIAHLIALGGIIDAFTNDLHIEVMETSGHTFGIFLVHQITLAVLDGQSNILSILVSNAEGEEHVVGDFTADVILLILRILVRT